eukprot:TRINITY_DN336_c0_g1_i1.p1 TRINITY_DN336_c0_g1~~TRINITY_DN336_c0_g1_i1.p1  ORF type:complete len:643 (-),score=122.55 TRINITY_DN336_c0_g1_i1:134-2062(-)
MKVKFKHLSFFDRLRSFPAFVFYRHLFTRNRSLLLSTFAVNYLMPFVLEILPWFLCRRVVAARLRDRQNHIQHALINSKKHGLVTSKDLYIYVLLSVVVVILETFEQKLKQRVASSSRLEIRRLVLERILYSEISAVEELNNSGKTSKTGSNDLESAINKDVTQTMALFNQIIPGILQSSVSLVRELMTFYRGGFALVSLMQPAVTWLISNTFEVVTSALSGEKRQEKRLQAASTGMTRLIQSSVEGLAEIQINNLQQEHIRRLDGLIEDELETNFSLSSSISHAWRKVAGKKQLLQFVGNVVATQKIMQSYNMTHEQYRKSQQDADVVFRLARKVVAYARTAKKTLDKQSEISKLLQLPSFQYECPAVKLDPLRCLTISHVQFAYAPQMPLALDLQGEICIAVGKTYAIVGQNRSGKSTLTNLICKLTQCSAGQICFNGTPYDQISRIELRKQLSYVTQKPFIFSGTIRENILIGNPHATHEQVLEAARMAGVLLFASDAQSHMPGSHAHITNLPPHLRPPTTPATTTNASSKRRSFSGWFGRASAAAVVAKTTADTNTGELGTTHVACAALSANCLRECSEAVSGAPRSGGPAGGGGGASDETSANELKVFSPRFRQYRMSCVGVVVVVWFQLLGIAKLA